MTLFFCERMYFHLIGIKTFQWAQQQLDILIWGGDLIFAKNFCEQFGVVIVSLQEGEENPNDFWNLMFKLEYLSKEVTLILKGEKLEDTAELFIEMGFPLTSINSITEPIPDNLATKLLENIQQKVKEKQGEEEEELEEAQRKETQKFEDQDVVNAVRIIDKNIERIEELLALWPEALPVMDVRKLNEYLIELQKIKMGNNFHKMAIVLDQAENLIFQLENYVLKEMESKNTVIDPNSVITHIDVIKEYNALQEAKEKTVLWRQLDLKEQLYSLLRKVVIYIKFFFKDLFHSATSLNFFMDQFFALLEYFVLLAIVFFSLLSFEPFFSFNATSGIYCLPFLGGWGFFICLYELFRKIFKGKFMRIVLFFVCAIACVVFMHQVQTSFAF